MPAANSGLFLLCPLVEFPLRFDELTLHPRLQQALAHLAFDSTTDIQRQAIPLILAGHDIAASSKTGSGKTLAFLLPMVHRLLTSKVLGRRGPRALVLAPTRELAKQVYAQLRLLIGATPLKATLVLGGENFNDQAKALQRHPQILIGTPGRIANHMSERSLFLDGLEILVMDEADRMLDLGFAVELKQIHEAANHRLRQTLMFSATLGHSEFEALAAILLQQPRRITVGREFETHEDIALQFVLADHLDHKEALLGKLLETSSYQQAIIFTATRADTERLATLYAGKGFTTTALSSDLSQSKRNAIMDSFSRGHQRLLFTTDIAARGLDLLNVSLVVNFDMPKVAAEFIHRTGRTGRAGAKGTAISLVSAKDWASYMAVTQLLGLPEQNFTAVPGLEARFTGVMAPVRKKKAAANPWLADDKAAEKAPGKRKRTETEIRLAAANKKRPHKQTPQLADADDPLRNGMAPVRRRPPEALPQLEEEDPHEE